MKKGTKLNVTLILFWLNFSLAIYALRKMYTPFCHKFFDKNNAPPPKPNYQSQLLNGQLILNPGDRCLLIKCASYMAFFILTLTVLTVDQIESSRLEHSLNFVPFVLFFCELHFLRWPNLVELFHFNLFNSNFLQWDRFHSMAELHWTLFIAQDS